MDALRSQALGAITDGAYSSPPHRLLNSGKEHVWNRKIGFNPQNTHFWADFFLIVAEDVDFLVDQPESDREWDLALVTVPRPY